MIKYCLPLFFFCSQALHAATTISWDHTGEHVDSFIIYKSVPGESSSIKMATLNNQQRSFETEEPCNTFFFMYACNSSKCSEPSIVVRKECPAPATPASLLAQ